MRTHLSIVRVPGVSRPSIARRFLPDRKLAYVILTHHRRRNPDSTLISYAIEAERVHLASEQRRRYARQRKAAA